MFQASKQAQEKLNDKKSELEACKAADEDLQQQQMQATQDETAAHALQIREQQELLEAAGVAAATASQVSNSLSLGFPMYMQGIAA